jgi:hypothetical protein
MPKSALLFVVLALSSHMPASAVDAPSRSTLDTVKLRMERYNERQLDPIMELYADDVAIYKYPDQLLGKGKAHLRQVLEGTFKDSTPVTIERQLVQGNYVISEERVTYAGTAKHFVSIYEVRDGLIQSVRFIRD